MDLPYNAAAWLVDRHVDGGRAEQIAYLCGDQVQTYAALQHSVWITANGLRATGVEPGDRVVMVVNDHLAFPAAFLAGLLIGAIPIPVSTMLKASEIAVLVADSEAKVIVVSERHAGMLPSIIGSSSSITAAIVAGETAAESRYGPRPSEPRVGQPGGSPRGVVLTGPAPSAATDRAAAPTATAQPATAQPATAQPGVAPPGLGVPLHRLADFADGSEVSPAPTTADSPGFWLYTSGTTGQPKGAIHRHGDIEAVCDTYGRSVLAIGTGDVCYSVPKLFFAFGLGNSLFFPLAVGASAVIDPEPPNPKRAADLLARHRPTLFFAPPGFCAAMVDAGVPPDALSSVRAVVTAGETLPAELHRRFTDRFGSEMLDGIGSTEALHIFCSNHPGDVRPGWTGRPVAGYELRLLDDRGEDITEPDTSGALWVRGDSIAAGYWQRPELTASTFVDGWLQTGDVYQRSADGYFRFIGRNSDMIKAGGIWVSPAEVEGVLIEQEDVLEAAVVGGRDADGLEMTVAFVVARQGHTVDPIVLDGHCRARMAAFKRPRQIHVVDELPKTATGKIQRFALRARLDAVTPA
jgi:benzoate-CoA ligase family protein